MFSTPLNGVLKFSQRELEMTVANLPVVSANSLEAYIQTVNRYPMLTLE